MKQLSNIASFFIFPMTVLMTHFIAWQGLHLYTRFPDLDIPFHFIGGLSIAYTSARILFYLQEEKVLMYPLNRVIFLLLVFSLTATAAVFWEFVEFTIDQLFRTNVQVSLANTMQDQFMGILGGTTWLLLGRGGGEVHSEPHIRTNENFPSCIRNSPDGEAGHIVIRFRMA